MTTQASKKNIYFAVSIRGGRDDAPRYSAILEILRKFGHVFTEHASAEQLTDRGETASEREVHDRDLAWLKSADVVVAEVTTPSLGVGYEIARACAWKKPVLCLFRPDSGRSLSAMIAGCPGVTVHEYADILETESIVESFLRAQRE